MGYGLEGSGSISRKAGDFLFTTWKLGMGAVLQEVKRQGPEVC
jgi:hypothetical protein